MASGKYNEPMRFPKNEQYTQRCDASRVYYGEIIHYPTTLLANQNQALRQNTSRYFIPKNVRGMYSIPRKCYAIAT